MQGNSHEARTILQGLLHDQQNRNFYRYQAKQWLQANDEQFHATVAESISSEPSQPSTPYKLAAGSPPDQWQSAHITCGCPMCNPPIIEKIIDKSTFDQLDLLKEKLSQISKLEKELEDLGFTVTQFDGKLSNKIF